MIFKIILWINLSLLMLHELDAVRTKEWKMMFFMKSMREPVAEKLFIAAHFILLIPVFYMLEYHFSLLYWIVSVFFVFHQFLHFFFRKHPDNLLNNPFSNSIIRLMTIVSIAGIIYWILYRK